MTPEAAAARLALTPEFAPRRFGRFLAAGGTLPEAAGADPAAFSERLGMGRREALALARALRAADPGPELAGAARAGVALVPWGSAAYPAAFTSLSDPPPVVYRRGEILPCDGMAVALIGSRRASEYGLRVARSLAADLARAGVTVVGGLARGIDAAAHEASLTAGGRTIAVLGSGMLEPYPPEHVGLLEEVADRGAVLSEFPLHAPPDPRNFPRRNRLIAALSLAVVVVEASPQSGALSTARHALEQGREVYAVPGPIDSEGSEGTLQLLQEGAAAIGSAADVLALLGLCRNEPARLPEEERAVLACLTDCPATSEEVARATGMREEVAAGHLVTLEVRGLVLRGADGRYGTR